MALQSSNIGCHSNQCIPRGLTRLFHLKLVSTCILNDCKAAVGLRWFVCLREVEYCRRKVYMWCYRNVYYCVDFSGLRKGICSYTYNNYNDNYSYDYAMAVTQGVYSSAGIHVIIAFDVVNTHQVQCTSLVFSMNMLWVSGCKCPIQGSDRRWEVLL